MNDDTKNTMAFPAVLILLAAAAGLIIYNPSPLTVNRPDTKPIVATSGKVSARLWQDPFCAVLDAPSNELNRPYSFADLNKEVTGKESKKKIIVIGVMVPGAPYEEDAEMRIRRRYAVLSGLLKNEFIPEDSEHIRFVRYQPETMETVTSEKISLNNIVPFEWLKNAADDRSVLLLWLNNKAFSSAPIANLRQAFKVLGLTDKNADIKIIGPADSDTLVSMIKEAKGAKEINKSLPDIKFYSATATAEDEKLLEDAGGASETQVEEFFRNKGITFQRTIGTDHDLATALVQELKWRKQLNDNITIALVSEQDTSYGRHLPDTVKAAINNDKIEIIHFSYLRGIDGKLPGEQTQSKQSEKKDQKTDQSGSIREMEQAIGKSQFDYLRRLADKIYNIDSDRKKDRRDGITIIGVLGTDFYDKYLVLQALHQRMPSVLFFTTDLDARYLQPDYKKWTRNLIVASHFGFEPEQPQYLHELGSKAQNNLQLASTTNKKSELIIPPFRDTYQTSMFNATVMALYHEVSKEKVHIFEIGRWHAISLTDTRNVWPKRPFILFSCIISGLFLVYLSSFRIRTFLEKKITVLVLSCSIGLIAFLLFMHMINRPDQEPFFLFEGISIWPAVALRLISAVLSVGFIISAISSLSKNASNIKKDFFPGEIMCHPAAHSSTSWASGKVLSNIGDFIKKHSIYCAYKSESKEYDDDGKIFKVLVQYCNLGYWQSRLMRLLPIVIVYFVFAGLLMFYCATYFGMPAVPARGQASLTLYWVVLSISIVCFLILTFFVLDASRLCRFFINTIELRTPEWPAQSYRHFLVEPKKLPKIGASPESLISEWMAVKLVAERTDAVSKLIFYPVIVWLILFFSRSSYFDNWTTPVHLALIISLPAIYALSCALILRRSAEKMRITVINRLKRRRDNAVFDAPSDQKIIKQIEHVLANVKSIQTGAFSPFSQRPVVRSLLAILGGVGGGIALECVQWLNL